ncbi:hypothetical protein [uncultured Sphaerochaeta sp.]|uniref:hypothetical protein n=1 Tax=uncultured Sphaerochaeta sp. TaxID=886478 RepID=UPI002A0A9FBA|nr:hypothetical protein [uncultured Sphaerochaeta sp.]
MKKTILTLLVVFTVMASLSAYDDLGNLFSDSSQPLATTTQQRGIEGNGTVAFSLAGYPSDGAIVPQPLLTLNLTGNTQKTSVALSLDSSESQPITNLSLSIYEKNVRIEAGLLTKEWGRGRWSACSRCTQLPRLQRRNRR